MPRFKQTAEILKLMSKKESIRNVGVIAHIDHGKTTTTDALLIEAGLLSKQIAGSARVLDYLEEEQKRGITIKTANISLLREENGRSYLINLVDTPGHVDFTGKVARALRTIDGAIVVVDAVEEIMAQTETVTSQALQERVKPVLFVNKVDRLTQEMKMPPKEIETKLQRIIDDFNSLIETHAEPQFRKKWKVDAQKGSVAFGSALQKWGFTLKIAQEKGIKLGDYEQDVRQDKNKKLSNEIPLHKAIFDMVTEHLPNPVESQEYRVPRIWKGDINSEIGRAMVRCDENGPTTMFVTTAQTAPEKSLIATGRLFSGSIADCDEVYLVNRDKRYQVQKVFLYMGPFKEPVSSIKTGNIAAVSDLDGARAGDTLVDFAHGETMVPFENVEYLSEPVMTISLEPKNPSDLIKLAEAMNKISVEDPNLVTSVNQETGQYLMSGIGELHLETSLNSLRQKVGDVELTVSRPITSYRETVSKPGRIVATKTPNMQNRLWVHVLPADLERQKTEDVWVVDHNKNCLVNKVEDGLHLNEARTGIIEGFNWACKTGILCEQPLYEIKAELKKTELHDDPALCESEQIARAMSRAVLGSFLTGAPVLLEPVYNIEVSVQSRWFGTCANIITNRRGKILKTEQKESHTKISGYIPVAESYGLSREMRSATSGYAFWQFTFDHWSKVPDNIAKEIIGKLRRNRGLPEEIPKPEILVDEA